MELGSAPPSPRGGWRRNRIVARAARAFLGTSGVLCKPLPVMILVITAFLTGLSLGHGGPVSAPVVAQRSWTSSLAPAPPAAAAAVAPRSGARSASASGDADDAGAAVRLPLAPLEGVTAEPLLPSLYTSMPRALPRATPLLAIYGDMSYWARYVRVEFYQLFSLLTNAYGWKVVMPPPAALAAVPQNTSHPIVGSGVDPGVSSWAEFQDLVVASIGDVPDVLLFAEDFMALGMGDWFPRLGKRDPTTPIGRTAFWVFGDDVHWHNSANRVRKAAIYTGVDRVVSCYSYLLPSLYPEMRPLFPLRWGHTYFWENRTLGVRSVTLSCPQAIPAWLPHSASTIFQLPLHPDPIPKVLLSGKTTARWYEYRQLMEAKAQANDPRVVQLAHPGQYDLKYNSTGDNGVGTSFASVLNKFLVCFTDGLFLNYAVAKVFEIPATGCLLLINEEMVPILDRLGFVPQVHYAVYNRDNLDAVMDTLLDPANRAAVDAMRRAGQELVWARHMTTHRAGALHQMALEAQTVLPRAGNMTLAAKYCRNPLYVAEGVSPFFAGFPQVLARLNKAVYTYVRG